MPCLSRHRVSRCVENIEPGSAMSPRRRARFRAHHSPEIEPLRGEAQKPAKHAVLRDRIRDGNESRHAAMARAVRIFGYVDVCCRMEKSPCGAHSRDVAMPLDPRVKLAYVCRADSGEMQHRRWPWSKVPSSMRERVGRIGALSVRGLQTIRTTRITSCPVPLLRCVPRCASITICHDHP